MMARTAVQTKLESPHDLYTNWASVSKPHLIVLTCEPNNVRG